MVRFKLKAIFLLSVPNCSYWITIHVPYHSLDYHATLKSRNWGFQNFAVYVFDFSCRWKVSRFGKSPFFCTASLKQLFPWLYFTNIVQLCTVIRVTSTFWHCNKTGLRKIDKDLNFLRMF